MFVRPWRERSMLAGAVMVFGFTTTYAISAYHHCICYELESRSGRCTTLCDKVCHWRATGRRFSPGPPVSATNKNWPPWYSWNIDENGVKHHQTNRQSMLTLYDSVYPIYSVNSIKVEPPLNHLTRFETFHRNGICRFCPFWLESIWHNMEIWHFKRPLWSGAEC